MTLRTRPAVVALVLAAVTLLAGCGSSGESGRSGPAPGGRPGSTILPVAPGQPGAGTPQPQTNCTRQAADPAAMAAALGSARPGDRICLSGDMRGARLEVHVSGTRAQPIVVLGGGKTVTGGVTVEASNVAVDGVAAEKPEAPGISLGGNNLSLTNSTVRAPHGGDGDGIRFWGDDITIAHNTVSDTRGRTDKHADCMQTFATDEDHQASADVVIDGNRCEKIDNICLIAEGPNSEAGDGSGDGATTRLRFTGNYCQNRAGQAVFLDDVSDAVITGNEIVGKIDKAFALQNGSTGAVIRDNRVASSVGYEVGLDDSSEQGYQGPEPGGAP
jgi:hypothetical protein